VKLYVVASKSSRNSLVSFKGIAFRKRKCALTSYFTLEMLPEGNAPKIENHQLVFPLQQCSSTPVGFGQVFLTKEQGNNTAAPPILSLPGSSRFCPFPPTENSMEGTAHLWIYWHHQEWDGRAERAFTKWLPGMSTTLLQSLVEIILAQGDNYEGNLALIIVLFCISQK